MVPRLLTYRIKGFWGKALGRASHRHPTIKDNNTVVIKIREEGVRCEREAKKTGLYEVPWGKNLFTSGEGHPMRSKRGLQSSSN